MTACSLIPWDAKRAENPNQTHLTDVISDPAMADDVQGILDSVVVSL